MDQQGNIILNPNQVQVIQNSQNQQGSIYLPGDIQVEFNEFSQPIQMQQTNQGQILEIQIQPQPYQNQANVTQNSQIINQQQQASAPLLSNQNQDQIQQRWDFPIQQDSVLDQVPKLIQSNSSQKKKNKNICVSPGCNNEGNFTPPCQHKLCTFCIQEYTLIACDGDPSKINRTLCSFCQRQLPNDLIINAFGGEKTFQEMFQTNKKYSQQSFIQLQIQKDPQLAQFQNKMFYCGICCTNQKLDNAIILEKCNHVFCEASLFEYLKLKINNAEVDENSLHCPHGECKAAIDPGQIEFILRFRQDLLQKYERFQVQKIEQYGEKLVTCPKKSCNYQFIIAPPFESIQCSICKIIFCPLCLKQPHYQKTCEEFANENLIHSKNFQNEKKAEEQFQKLVKKQHWQQCPNCKAMVERTQGCNHMTCQSPICNGKYEFCYICAKKWHTCKHTYNEQTK